MKRQPFWCRFIAKIIRNIPRRFTKINQKSLWLSRNTKKSLKFKYFFCSIRVCLSSSSLISYIYENYMSNDSSVQVVDDSRHMWESEHEKKIENKSADSVALNVMKKDALDDAYMFAVLVHQHINRRWLRYKTSWKLLTTENRECFYQEKKHWDSTAAPAHIRPRSLMISS